MPLSAGLIKSLGGPTLRSFTEEDKSSSLNKAQSRIDNARTRLDSLGYEAPEPKDSFLVGVLKNLSRTGYAANNVIREFTDGDAGATSDKFDPFKAFGRGLSLDEQVEGKDIFEGLGMEGDRGVFGGENKWYNPSPAGAAGLALDVLNPLDLLNWLSFGMGKAAIKGGSVGAEAIAKTFGSKADDIIKATGDLSQLKAGNVGDLVTQLSNNTNLTGNELNDFIKTIREGLTETGSKATDKVSKLANKRRLTLGIQNPLTLGRGQEFLKTEIPGTGAIGGALTSLGDSFKKSRLGNELSKRFSTKHVPTDVPDIVVMRNLTGYQLDSLIRNETALTGDLPFNKDELFAIKGSLDQVKSLNGQATIQSISEATGFEPKDLMSLFESEVPFTFDVVELFDAVRKYHPDLDSKVAFLQSVKLRKVMDDIYGDIPESIRDYFKGTVKLPDPVKSFSDTPTMMDDIDQMNPDSPMLSYVFNVKGVDVVVPIKSTGDFNPGGLESASRIIKAINNLDDKNLNAIKGQVRAMPGELGVIDGETIRGYYNKTDIVLRQPESVDEFQETIPHEFGHSAMETYGVKPSEYEANVMKGTFIDEYAEANGPKDDFAVSVEWMKNRPEELKAKFPERYDYIKGVMSKNEMTEDELIERLSSQGDRSVKMESMGGTGLQLEKVISQIDNYVSTSLISKSGADAYKEFKGTMHELYENVSLSKVEDFVQQVEGIFKNVPVEERKAIMDIASGVYDNPNFLASTFYNKSQKVIEAKMGGKMPSAELRKMLLANGVKEDELKWLNIDELLASKDTITKQEMLRHLAMNNLEIEEVTLGGSKFEKLVKPSELDDIPDNIYQLIIRNFNDDIDGENIVDNIRYADPSLDYDEAEEIYDRVFSTLDDVEPNSLNAKYNEYRSMPDNGEDYQELLLKLPQGYDLGMGQRQVEADLTAIQKKLDEMKEEINKSRVFPHQNDPRRELLNEYHSLQMRRHDILEQIKAPESSYQSGHWDDENVVAHVRYDTREVNGEKVLFIQEMQSDWHQSGRKKGYQKPFEHQAELDDLHRQLTELDKEYDALDISPLSEDLNDVTAFVNKKVKARREISKRMEPLTARVLELEDIQRKGNELVPKAPFEKNWPNLIMKRMLRHAAENGYDRIAWATGKQNADLYSLARSYKSVEYNPSTKRLIARTAAGSPHPIENVTPDNLSDYVGEELANKLMKVEPPHSNKKFEVRPPDKEIDDLLDFNDPQWSVYDESGDLIDIFDSETDAWNWIIDEADKRIVDGIDLEMGGEGMKGFYDKMVPDMFNSYLKKFGIKVEDGANKSVKLNDQVKNMVLNEGQPLFKKGAKGKPKAEPKLSKDGEAALRAFYNWRQSVVKMYNEAQIPIAEMEKYVPFIPQRPLKGPEKQLLNSLYGTGTATHEVDPLIQLLSGTDPNLLERTTKANTPSEVNKLLDKPWLTEDAAIAMATRGARAIRTTELSKALDGLVSQYGRSYDEILSQSTTGGIPAGYKMYTISQENGRKVLNEVFDSPQLASKNVKSFFIPEEMAKVYNMYADLIMGEEKKGAILKLFDQATAAYKKVAYLWNPGHIVRDFEGNVFNNYLMGVVNPLTYVKAAKLLRNPESMITVDGAEITVKELLDKSRKVGLLDVGSATAESPYDIMSKLKSSEKNLLQKAGNRYTRLMREGTRKADMFTRFTGLVHNLDQGMSFNEATTEVKKFLFDYFELTPFERKVMRRIVPFYTWMRKNIPLQVEQVMKNPRNYSRIESVMTAAEEDTIDWDSRPDYINDTGSFKMGEEGDYVAPNLPFNDLARVPTGLDSILQLLSGVNPIIKAPIEMATNQQWFNGRPLEEYPNETREIPFAGLLKLLGVDKEELPRIDKRTLGYLFDQIPLLRNLDVMSNPDNPRQMSRASSFLGGPSIYSKESVETSEMYETERVLADFLKKLKDEGIDVPTIKELKSQPNKIIKIRDMLR